MPEQQQEHTISLANQQNEGNEQIEILFKEFYTPLCRYVFKMIRDKDACEDIVQDVFMKVWSNKENLRTDGTAKAYLYRAVYNTALNYIEKSKKTVGIEDADISSLMISSISTDSNLEFEEVQEKINEALDKLPPRCKSVFLLSRYENMTYTEIAKSLDISIKTVENQMGKALAIMRVALEPYIKYLFTILFLFLLLHFN